MLDDLFQIHWLETVLYNPDGEVDDSPLYTFKYNPENPPPPLPEEGYGSPGGGGGGDTRPSYPPVDPYRIQGYIGVKQASGVVVVDAASGARGGGRPPSGVPLVNCRCPSVRPLGENTPARPTPGHLPYRTDA